MNNRVNVNVDSNDLILLKF